MKKKISSTLFVITVLIFSSGKINAQGWEVSPNGFLYEYRFNSGLIGAFNNTGSLLLGGTIQATNFNTSSLNNVSIGAGAGANNTSGIDNMYIGTDAGNDGTTGRQNVAIGYNALNRNQTGWRNMAIGSYALGDLVNQTGNTAVGYDAGRHARNTKNSTYIGYDAGRRDFWGELNTIIGGNAAEKLGEGLPTSGNHYAKTRRNTIIGAAAFATATEGSGNVVIGYQVASQRTAMNNELWIDNSNTNEPLISGNFFTNELVINGDHIVKEHLIVGDDDDDEMDTSPYRADYKAWVHGGLVSTDLAISEVTDWEDRVFKSDYYLSSLAEVEAHIKEKGHLHTMPSEAEIIKNGYSVEEMDKKIVRTVEELTLYTIEQQKTIKAQNAMIQDLIQRIEKLESASK